MADEPVDLYAGLTVPPPKKRRVDVAAISPTTSTNTSVVSVKSAGSESSSEPSTKKPKMTNDIDVLSAISRLKTHMLVDKKFTKATTLFCTLLREKLTPETSDLFFDALIEMINAKGSSWSGKPEFAQLITLVFEHQEVFAASKRLVFVDWRLLAITHHDLFTDDTFQFARAAKQIKQRVDAAVETTDPESRAAALTLLMPLLRTLFSRHTTAWAKTSVETVLGVCTRHRRLFSDPQRDEVDLWTKTTQERRHASTVTRSSGADARRNIVELTNENASQAKAKVGRSNHPLFNRDP